VGRSISSAEPEKLLRYADFTTWLDQELISRASHLVAGLQRFEATCTEPGINIPSSNLGAGLRSYGSQSASIDGWVRDVGKAFQLADGIWSGWPSSLLSSGRRLVLATLFPGLATALLFPILPVPDWLARLFSLLPWVGQGTTPSPSIEPGKPSPDDMTAPDRSGFGELLRRAEEEKKAKAEPVAPSSSPPAVMPAALLYQVPALEQKSGSYECAPTSVSMILQYYHSQDNRHRSLSPSEVKQGLGSRFNSGSGISADKLVAGLQDMNLGYQTIEWKAELDKEALISELREGPVIAQVHLHLGTSGYAHMVVVTGVSDDGNKVYLNDPWTGKQRELTWEAFEKTWTFSQNPGASHLIVRIRP
jgi:uncharacterized protein YvpB